MEGGRYGWKNENGTKIAFKNFDLKNLNFVGKTLDLFSINRPLGG
jgi:hypothetical protein